jgi:hypothetical protein
MAHELSVGVRENVTDSVFHALFVRFAVSYSHVTVEQISRTRDQCLRWDKRRTYLSNYKKQAKAKEKRNRIKFEKLRVGKLKLAKDNARALTYESGIAGPQVGGRKVGGSNARVICRACGEIGHQRKSSKKCLKSTNPDSEHYKKKGSLESRLALEGECV